MIRFFKFSLSFYARSLFILFFKDVFQKKRKKKASLCSSLEEDSFFSFSLCIFSNQNRTKDLEKSSTNVQGHPSLWDLTHLLSCSTHTSTNTHTPQTQMNKGMLHPLCSSVTVTPKHTDEPQTLVMSRLFHAFSGACLLRHSVTHCNASQWVRKP